MLNLTTDAKADASCEFDADEREQHTVLLEGSKSLASCGLKSLVVYSSRFQYEHIQLKQVIKGIVRGPSLFTHGRSYPDSIRNDEKMSTRMKRQRRQQQQRYTQKR